jgi:nicotinate phosphoribosyltransferase
MIESILDNDLYKLTMQQAVHALYPRAEVEYVFINRGKNAFPEALAEQLTSEIQKMADLCLTAEELAYLEETCYFLTPVYLDFLEHYRFDPREVTVRLKNGELEMTIQGPWFRTILWEVPLMALVSELCFSITGAETLSADERGERNAAKAERLKAGDVQFADFGTRRRFSSANQARVLEDILSVEGNTLAGTSNVHFARSFDIKPIGTHAHEWFMFHGATYGYRLANKAAVEAWTRVYQGNLGIALTDTYTTDVFLESFDSVTARLFDGVRQDSGDPFEFTDKLVAHYERLRIDPLTKTIVFSDGLNADTAVAIRAYCQGKINASFGIGTHLTNDIGPEALNMVIKLSCCRDDNHAEWVPVVKLSDDEGKHTGTEDEIALCLRTVKGRKP